MHDKSMFGNFGQQLLFLPSKSRARVEQGIETRRAELEGRNVRRESACDTPEKDLVTDQDSQVTKKTHCGEN